MNYQEVRHALEKIVPEMRDTKDPEGTLLKFANENNLYPSQLEKLGQSVNTLKTLSFFEKAANRGDSFGIVDVPRLVGDYRKPEDLKEEPAMAKAASEVDPNDINAWCDAPARDSSEDAIPNFYAEAAGEGTHMRVKLAKQIDSIHKSANDYWDAIETDKGTAQLLDQIEGDYAADVRDIFQKLASHIQLNIKFETMEEDAIRLYGDGVKQACDTFSRYLDQCNVVHDRVDEAVIGHKKLAQDRTGLASVIKEAQAGLDMIISTRAFRKQATLTQQQQQSTAVSGTGKEEIPHHAGAPEMEEQKKKEPSEGGVVESVLQSLERPMLKNVAGGVTSLRKEVNSDSKKFKREQSSKIDAALDNAEAQSSLQKLMISDPIISEADPELVKELYQTISNHAPDMARDIGMLRFALREAIQYEGVPPQTVKDLMEMQKTKSTIKGTDVKRRVEEQNIQ